MVQPEPSARALLTVLEAGQRLAEARRAWAEAFLRYKMAKSSSSMKITDNVAKAQADIEVDVTTAEVDYRLSCYAVEHY